MKPPELVKPMDDLVHYGCPFWIAFFVGLLVPPALLYSSYYRGIPERDFLAALGAALFQPKRQYTLYTGTKGGTYDRLGNEIVEQIRNDPAVRFKVTLTNTSGSLDNATNLNGSCRALAFVTEPLVAGLYQAQAPTVQRIAILYMQKAFLAYNEGRWRKFVDAQCGGAARGGLRLTDDKDSCAYRFLAQARWDPGPLGGGGRLILNHLLHAADLRLGSIDGSPSIQKQADSLRAGDTDVAFCFSGDVNALYEAVNTARDGAKGDPLGMAGVDAQLGMKVQSIQLRPTSFSAGAKREVETLGAYAVLVASPDLPPGDAAVLVEKASSFVQEMSKTGTHLENVAAALRNRSNVLRAHLFGVAGQFVLMMVISALLCGIGVSAIDSRRHRKRIMQEHSRYLQGIGRLRDRVQTPAAAPAERERLVRDLQRTRMDIHRLAVDGRLSLPHRDQLLASAAAVESELKADRP